MLSRKQTWFLVVLAAVLFTVTSIPSLAQQTSRNDKTGRKKEGKDAAAGSRADAARALPASLWRDPGDIASLDLIHGQGGAEHAPSPNARYTFIKEDLNGTSPKFYVKDDGGVEWLVKQGPESKPETAATRLVWAMGYFTDEDYFLPKIHVAGIHDLHRKTKDLLSDGTALNVRLKRQGAASKALATWDWYSNPFVGQREFNGLRVMMALINNWDLKSVNNKIYATDTERRYTVSDLGASFGRTGAVTTRSKGALNDYQESRFIKTVDAGTVSFEMRTRPAPVLAPFEPKNFKFRGQMEQIEDKIPVGDALWIGGQLAKLTPGQIADAFRTAGFSEEEVQGYSVALEKRIHELNELVPTVPPPQ